MAESTFSKIKDEVTKSPAADQLKEELQHYLQARAEHAVTNSATSWARASASSPNPARDPAAW